MPETTHGAPRSRRDVLRNHTLLVAAARETFAEQGLDARLDEIARRAGLGTGTLYRHFPNREALVEAILAERMDEILALARTALEAPRAWDGLVAFLEAMLELQLGDRVLKEIFLRYPPSEDRVTEARGQLRDLFGRLLERARSEGAIRSDFALPDLALLLWSFAPVIDATVETAPNAWRRHLHWFLDGLRPGAATPQSEPPLDDAQLVEAMRCLREHRFHHRSHSRRRTGDMS
jgi:AcrR family transcriptional regulator